MAEGCISDKGLPVMEFIYPVPGVKIYIPRDHLGSLTRIIPEVVHRTPSKKIFWHLDDKYIGTTKYIHQLEIEAETGDHILTVVDEDGSSVKCQFTILSRKN